MLHGTAGTGPGLAEKLLNFPVAPTAFSGVATGTSTLLTLFPNVRWVFPTGRKRYVKVLQREANAWFDMEDFTDRTVGEEDQIEGLRDSVLYLGDVVEKERAILDRIYRPKESVSHQSLDGAARQHAEIDIDKRIFFGGFSQGSAMTATLLLSGELHRKGESGTGIDIGGFFGLSESYFHPIM